MRNSFRSAFIKLVPSDAIMWWWSGSQVESTSPWVDTQPSNSLDTGKMAVMYQEFLRIPQTRHRPTHTRCDLANPARSSSACGMGISFRSALILGWYLQMRPLMAQSQVEPTSWWVGTQPPYHHRYVAWLSTPANIRMSMNYDRFKPFYRIYGILLLPTRTGCDGIGVYSGTSRSRRSSFRQSSDIRKNAMLLTNRFVIGYNMSFFCFF